MKSEPQGGEAGDMNRNNNKGEAQQPQKCPRCDSLNTKFCYYNNYSLSQPRYFCKSCRRYWTQGGTLRNVRVGGGCRKPKRVKTSASSSSSSADTHPPPPQQDPVIQKDTPSAVQGSPAPPAAVPPISPFSGYLSSLAGMNPSQPLDQMGGSSNLGLLSGFYEMGIMREREELESSSLFETEQGLMIQSSTTPHTGGHDWTVTESLMHNHNGNQRAGGSDASAFWSTTVTTTTTPTTTTGNSESTNPASFISLIPNHQWPHLPGYHPLS